MRILALDQASRTSGYAIFENNQLIDSGTFTLMPDDIGERLVQLRNEIIKFIQYNQIDIVLFEDIQLQSGMAGVTTYKVLAEVFGVIQELVTELGIEYHIVHSQTWKSALNIKGKARAEQKKNAQAYVNNTYNIKVTQDAADAICIGASYLKNNESAF